MGSELSKRYTLVKQFCVLMTFHLISSYVFAINLSSGTLQSNQARPNFNQVSRSNLELYLKENKFKLENSKTDLNSKNELRKSLTREFKLDLKNIHMGPGAGGGGNSCEILVRTTLMDLLDSLNELSTTPIMNELRTRIINIQDNIQFDIKNLNTDLNADLNTDLKNNSKNWTDAINIPELDVIILDNEICSPLVSKNLREANLLHELSSLLDIKDSNNKFEVSKLFLNLKAIFEKQNQNHTKQTQELIYPDGTDFVSQPNFQYFIKNKHLITARRLIPFWDYIADVSVINTVKGYLVKIMNSDDPQTYKTVQESPFRRVANNFSTNNLFFSSATFNSNQRKFRLCISKNNHKICIGDILTEYRFGHPFRSVVEGISIRPRSGDTFFLMKYKYNDTIWDKWYYDFDDIIKLKETMKTNNLPFEVDDEEGSRLPSSVNATIEPNDDETHQKNQNLVESEFVNDFSIESFEHFQRHDTKKELSQQQSMNEVESKLSNVSMDVYLKTPPKEKDQNKEDRNYIKNGNLCLQFLRSQTEFMYTSIKKSFLFNNQQNLIELMKQYIEQVDFYDQVNLKLNGRKVDAINYWSEYKIVFDTKVCQKINFDSYLAQALLLHEFLGLLRISDSNYLISRTFYFIEKQFVKEHEFKNRRYFLIPNGIDLVNNNKSQFLIGKKINVFGYLPYFYILFMHDQYQRTVYGKYKIKKIVNHKVYLEIEERDKRVKKNKIADANNQTNNNNSNNASANDDNEDANIEDIFFDEDYFSDDNQINIPCINDQKFPLCAGNIYWMKRNVLNPIKVFLIGFSVIPTNQKTLALVRHLEDEGKFTFEAVELNRLIELETIKDNKND